MKKSVFSQSTLYEVGYFEGAAQASFKLIRAFEQEQQARQYVSTYFLEPGFGLEQNVVIRHEQKLIFDGRWVRLS